MDIQDSPNLFSLAVADNEQLKAQYPQLEGHTGSTLEVAKYIHDQSIDTSDKSVVVDWYYKKAREDGPPLLHYCKFCNGVVLYASENDPALLTGDSTTTASTLCVRYPVRGRGQPGGLWVHRRDEGHPDRH